MVIAIKLFKYSVTGVYHALKRANKTLSKMFTVALFVIQKTWKQFHNHCLEFGYIIYGTSKGGIMYSLKHLIALNVGGNMSKVYYKLEHKKQVETVYIYK